MLKKSIYILLVSVFGFTSCYTYRDKTLLQTSTYLPVYDSVAFKVYHLRPGDEIIYRVISVDETAKIFGGTSNSISMDGGLNSQNMVTYRIYQDGTIDIPYVKSIKISGLTLPDAEKEIQQRIRKIIPDANVKIAMANNNFYTVGDIGNGTYYIYKDRMNIFQALAQTGLVPVIGDKKHIKILRQQPDGSSKVIEFDIRPKSVVNSEYYYVYPNDVIYVRRDPQSFYKVQNFGATLGLITSSFNFLATILLFNK
ncbi:MAG: polysaccharide biosynthesis/export family protein [Prevotellaceae bacterium]|jgi:polysaccharide export outer membrane protein|nr:polysaccharide biosynthesis/export family protein [Prevotellaceae bacterium]